jgi:hypothetical protein
MATESEIVFLGETLRWDGGGVVTTTESETEAEIAFLSGYLL